MDLDTIQPGQGLRAGAPQGGWILRCDAGRNRPALARGRGRQGSAAPRSAGRLRNPRDRDALERGVRVIPVLVDSTEAPRADELPPALASLATRQGVWLVNNMWGASVENLVEILASADDLGPESDPSPGAPPTEPVRKRVAIATAVVDFSTRDATNLDPEVELAIANRVRSELTAIAARYGGALEANDSETVQMLFGVDRLHEDDALRAASAAIDAHAICRGIDWGAVSPAIVRLQLRIGVDVGDVVASGYGDQSAGHRGDRAGNRTACAYRGAGHVCDWRRRARPRLRNRGTRVDHVRCQRGARRPDYPDRAQGVRAAEPGNPSRWSASRDRGRAVGL